MLILVLIVLLIIIHTIYYVRNVEDKDAYTAHVLLNSAAFGVAIGVTVSGMQGVEVVSQVVLLVFLMLLALILGIYSKIRMPRDQM